MLYLERGELAPCPIEPLVCGASSKLAQRAAMAGKQRRTDSKPESVEVVRKVPDRLRGVAKAVKDEHRATIRRVTVDWISARNDAIATTRQCQQRCLLDTVRHRPTDEPTHHARDRK
jgi:hypothetical protein